MERKFQQALDLLQLALWNNLYGVKAISGKRLKLTFIVFILLVLKQKIPLKESPDIQL